MKDGTSFWRSPAGMLVLGSVVAVHLVIALPRITSDGGQTGNGSGEDSDVDPMTRFENLGPSENIFDAFERWDLAGQTGCWVDLSSLDWFGVLMGEHETLTADGRQILVPKEDILVGLVFANGERAALVVPEQGEVVALSNILAFHFSERQEVVMSASEPSIPSGEVEITPFQTAGAVTFGGLDTCWQSIEVEGTSELRKCAPESSLETDESSCVITMRNAVGETTGSWSFSCGSGAIVRPLIVEGQTYLSIEP